MKIKIKNINGTSRSLSIEVSPDELKQEFDRVYTDMRKIARVPGFRMGKAPRDLLEIHYGKKAQEEVIRRAVPEYYLKAIRKENLIPVTPPEIENVQFKEHTLSFGARVDVKPQVKLKVYKNLRITKKRINIEKNQIEQTLERLRQSRAEQTQQPKEKQKTLPELDDAFAKDLGFATLDELKEVVNKNLQADAQLQIKIDMEKQIIEQLLNRASLDVPQSLVNSQRQELLSQLKLNRVLQGDKKENLESKEKELQDEAGKEAFRRVKLSFILEEIAQRENIQANEEDLEKRIEAIAQRSGKNKDEVREYLKRENLIPGLKAELRNKKTMEFLLNEAKVEEKNREG